MKKYYLFIFALVFTVFQGACQSAPPSDLSGADLRSWLKTNWYDGKHSQLGYNNARRAMYSYVDESEDGRVYCVYTGFSQPARETTFLDPINAEHTVPQSFFSEDEPMRSDIHHLFPTHQIVNSSRGNIDFGEVDDAITDKWFIGGRVEDGTSLTILTSIPTSNIDDYSEIDNSDFFEVKEDNKGNTARAVFYFYTVYPTQGGSIEDLADLDVLLAWHANDPVDDAERRRHDRAAERQGNRNPYIDYADLAQRAWGDPNTACTAPTQPAQAGTATDIASNAVTVSWENGNGGARLVLVKEGSSFTTAEHPTNGISYNTSDVFGQASGLGDAFPVYNGTGNSVEVLNLDNNKTYAVKVIEYKCSDVLYGTGYEFTFNTGTTTGLSEDLASAGLAIMPNPAYEVLRITSTTAKAYTYRLINMLGQELVKGSGQSTLEEINVANYQEGLYLLHLQRDGKQWVARVQIQ